MHEQQDGTLTITLQTHPQMQTTIIRSATEGLRQAVRCLASTGGEDDQLERMVLEHDGIGGLAVWYYWRRQFQEQNLLCHPIEFQGTRLATLFSASSEPVVSPPALKPTDAYVLSRFAYCRRAPQSGGGLLLETPLSPFSLLLHDPEAFALIGALSSPKTAGEIAEELLGWLVVTRLVVAHDGEEGHPELPYWEFHDLLFHSRSRMGRSTAPFGGTYRFGKSNPPAPVRRHALPDEIYPLYRPDPKQGMAAFDAVLENRRSVRAFDDEHPLTLQQLGEFLYRAAREQQPNKRPYPTAGALYELEIYLAVHHTKDLPKGLYHYNPVEHQLCRIKDATPEIDHFVLSSRRSAQLPDESASQPQVLILIASRHPKASWKYESIAYASTLKNTGALYQTMYLVAAAMGLGGTAVGSGDSDRFARLTGLDYYEETLVGEFLLGTPARR